MADEKAKADMLAMAQPKLDERRAYALAADLAELADEILTSEGDAAAYEIEMERLRNAMTLRILAAMAVLVIPPGRPR